MPDEGIERLKTTLKEYRDLRGFYFGVRSVLYRMCKPSEDGETVYTQLREIQTQKKGDGLYIDYRPLRVQNVTRITYTANTTSALLKPLRNPVQKGDEPEDFGARDIRADGMNLVIQLGHRQLRCAERLALIRSLYPARSDVPMLLRTIDFRLRRR